VPIHVAQRCVRTVRATALHARAPRRATHGTTLRVARTHRAQRSVGAVSPARRLEGALPIHAMLGLTAAIAEPSGTASPAGSSAVLRATPVRTVCVVHAVAGRAHRAVRA
jgi:hypothetical protein